MASEQAISLEFQLDGANFEQAGEASSKIKRILQQLGISPEIVRRIAISSYEAENECYYPCEQRADYCSDSS